MTPRRPAKNDCKDCGAKLKEKDGKGTGRVRKPGPRCATCYKAYRRSQSAGRKAAHLEKNFSITEEQYQLLLAAQGGVCYICLRPPGRRFRLAVDHDHSQPCCGTEHPVEKGCEKCIRGLLHRKPCNTWLGWIGDDPLAGTRTFDYLTNPPARAILRGTQ